MSEQKQQTDLSKTSTEPSVSIQENIVTDQVETKVEQLRQQTTNNQNQHQGTQKVSKQHSEQIKQTNNETTQQITIEHINQSTNQEQKYIETRQNNRMQQNKQLSSDAVTSVPISIRTGSIDDLDQETVKQTKTSKRLAKFKQKNKKEAPKIINQQQAILPVQKIIPKPELIIPSIQKPVIQIKQQIKISQEENDQQNELNQSEILRMMIESKKKQNFRSFKEWDEKRKLQVLVHFNIVDGLERSLDNAARTSFDNIEIYLSTFKQILNQQEKYSSYPVTDISSLSINNEISKNLYINCSCLLSALNEENNQRLRKAKLFANHISTKVLKNVLDVHLKKFQQTVSNLKGRISGVKTSLINNQLELEQKTITLTNYFKKQQSQFQKGKEVNLYEMQFQFLDLAYGLTALQQQYAQLTLQYYQLVQKMEIQRVDTVKQSIKIYSQGLRDIYESKAGQETLSQLKKSEQQLLIACFYSLDKLIPVNLQDAVKQKLGVVSSSLTLQLLEKYLSGFVIVKFDLRQLVLKQYHVASSFHKNSTLLITVDRFVHIFCDQEGYLSSVKSYHIDQHLRLKRKGYLRRKVLFLGSQVGEIRHRKAYSQPSLERIVHSKQRTLLKNLHDILILHEVIQRLPNSWQISIECY